MTLTTDTTFRFCSRCRLPLTDAASRECGVGPICRRKDNHLFAKTIQANFPMAMAMLLSIPATGECLHPESVVTFKRMRRALMRKSQAAGLANPTDENIFHQAGQDLRAVVTDLDFLCSFDHTRTSAGRNPSVRTVLVEVVRHLGYVGLAGVLDGVASTSAARIWFENGRVFLEGLGCTDGFRAMRSIPGIVTPRRRGDRTPYSAPASQARAFLANVARFWPMYEGGMATITEQAASYADSHAAAPVAAPAVPTFRAVKRTADFYVEFPWVRGANMMGLTTAFKTIPSAARSYDPAARRWSFRMEHLDAVLRMARESNIFGLVVTDENSVSSPVETPSSLYSNTAARRYPYLARRPWRPSYGRL